jgi:ubiquinone/menaquinone biosynthesis C-methylase UbiE
MTATREVYDRIRSFWDKDPCGSTHVSPERGTKEFFLAIDRYFKTLYPYLDEFLDAKNLTGKRVMEIGLGSGYTLRQIAQNAKVAYGLDLSLETLRLNQSRAKHFGLDTHFIHASATKLPLPDECLDVVVSIGCIHHIPDIEQAIDEICRVLRPGGIFKGMVYNKNSYRYHVSIPLARRFSARWRGKTQGQCVNEMYDGSGNPYGTVYSKKEMMQLLSGFTQIQFQVQNFSGHDVIPKVGDLIPRRFWLETLGKVAGLDLYFSAVKPGLKGL